MDTRRSFLRNCALTAFGFAVLSPAKTYERIWKAVATPRINPEWVNVAYRIEWCFNVVPAPLIRYECVDGVFRRVDTFTG